MPALYALALRVLGVVLFWHQSEVTLHLSSSLPELILGSVESLRLEKTSKITKSNHQAITTIPTKRCPQMPHLHGFEPRQVWGLPHYPGQPGPMPDHSLTKEIFPNIQSKPPLMQLEAIAPRPVASYLGEEPNPPSLPLPGRELQRARRSSLSLLFSRLNSPSSPSRSPSDWFSRPLPSLAALLWTRSSPSMSCLW